LARYAAFCDRHERAFRWLLRVQGLVSRVNPTPLMTPALRAMSSPRFIAWSFGHYLRIAPPEFALESELPPAEPVAAAA
jgi:menaquinone-9 beta-reductase